MVDTLMEYVAEEIQKLGICIEQSSAKAAGHSSADTANFDAANIEDRLATLCTKLSMLNAILVQSVPAVPTRMRDNQPAAIE
ncbi:MAG: hypothetical protein H7144_11630 [Burkholderiales bacterium]|nr:hypothetical protein [Phycisphaerae bacterium]